jgi:hypothetical protein
MIYYPDLDSKVNLVESYNFYINFISIRVHTKRLRFFENELNSTAVWYGGWTL